MTDADDSLSGLLTEEVTSQLDATALLDDSLAASLDGEDLGASLGGELGERVGRELGESIGREVQAAFGESVERGDDLGELTDEITSAVRDALLEALGDAEGLESIVGSVQEAAIGGPPADDEEESTPAEDDAEQRTAESDAAEQAPSEGDAEEPTAATGDEEGSEGASAADMDLGELRRETLTDFLEVMDYRDLQSVAKDVGVKANLAREEMTDEIIEAVSDDGSEAEDESADAEEGAE